MRRKECLDRHEAGTGEVGGVVSGISVDLLEGYVVGLESLLSRASHTGDNVKDLEDRGALRAAVGDLAAQDVVGGDAGLAVSRAS